MNAFAAKAVGWITAAIKVVSQVRKRVRGGVVKVKRYLQRLVDLEQSEGATTEAWSKIDAAAKAGTGVELTAAEAIYLDRFKDIWDDHFKKPLDRLASVLDPDGDGIVGVKLNSEWDDVD